MLTRFVSGFPARAVPVLALALVVLPASRLLADNIVTYNTQFSPHGIAFDGTNIWVANYGSNDVTKLVAATGAIVGTYPVGQQPQGVVFDGTNIWVVNSQPSSSGASTITKLAASTGALVGTYDVGTPPYQTGPYGITFDGTNIWVSENLTGSVAKIQASTGNVIGTYAVGNSPEGLTYDGANIWVANNLDGTVTELQASSGNVVNTIAVGTGPHGMTFDGTNVWVTNVGDGTVTELQASTGNVVGTYPVTATPGTAEPVGIVYGGGTIWVADFRANTVSRLSAATGAILGTDNVQAGPWDMVYDGASAWVTNYANNSVTKISPTPSITTNGIVPIYSKSTTIESGEWVSIYGSNFGTGTTVWNGQFPIPTTLGGTSVTIDGNKAFLWSVSPGQINLQMPTDSTIGSVGLSVTTATGITYGTTMLAAVAPSFSLLDATHVAGIILRSGGAYDILGPTGSSLGYATVAAKAGDTVELYGVGFGSTNPAVPAGQPVSGTVVTTNSVALSIAGKPVTPSFSGLSETGLYQLNITIPAGLGTGDVPLTATVAGATTQTGVVISLQ